MSIGNNLARDAITAQSISQDIFSGFPNEYEAGFGCALRENRVIIEGWDSPDLRDLKLLRDMVREHLAGVDATAISKDKDWFLWPSLMLVTEECEREYLAAIPKSVRLLAHDIHLQSILSAHHKRLSGDTYNTILRFLHLYLDYEEWEEGDPTPQDDTFRNMLNFLAAHQELRTPRFFLSRRGYCTVSWREASDKLTDFEFRPDGMVRWLVFAPPVTGSNTKERASGESSASMVLHRVRSFDALEWMNRAD